MRKDQFFNICLKMTECPDPLKKIQHIRRVLKSLGKKVQCFNGKGLVSMILPENFNYEMKNGADNEEPTVKIHRGVMYEGALDKNILGSTHNSIIQVLHKEHGKMVAMRFVDNIQFISNNWLLIEGFTVGINDCLVSDPEKTKEIKDFIQKCFMEADGITATTSHPGIREMRVNAALGKARDVGLKIAKDSLSPDNNFVATVTAGSKGDFFNIAQITGLLGQQNLKGQRIPCVLNNGKRTMVHYPFDCVDSKMEYESRGFISSSFINGLTPRECYFHAQSGREGCSDTALGTASSGYMQRKIVKLTEDLKVQYDGTVRDVNGCIYQMCYGTLGYDPKCTVKGNGQQEACDVGRLIARMNMEHELTIK
jgi:DNA-directed RNA polymerase beta' subunit